MCRASFVRPNAGCEIAIKFLHLVLFKAHRIPISHNATEVFAQAFHPSFRRDMMRTFHLVLALSFLYFAFCNPEDKKPYHVKKSSLCNSDIDGEVCTAGKYNFHSVVKEIVDNVDGKTER